MKNSRSLLFTFLLLTGIRSFAQAPNEKFVQGIQNGQIQMASAKTPDDFLKISNFFDRIAQAEPKEWTPAYYSAYNSLIAGLLSSDKTQKDQYWDKALGSVDKADALSTNNSEVYTLKGYIQFMKMSVDPQARMSFMGLSAASLGKAKALNSENPRIYLIQGQDTFYTPEAFGGGKAKAKPLLETAVEKFNVFKPMGLTDPNWGADQAKALLAQCN